MVDKLFLAQWDGPVLLAIHVITDVKSRPLSVGWHSTNTSMPLILLAAANKLVLKLLLWF